MSDPIDKKKVTPGEGEGEGSENTVDEKTMKAIKTVVGESLTPIVEMIKGLSENKDKKKTKDPEPEDDEDDDYEDDDDSESKKTKNKKQSKTKRKKPASIEEIVSKVVAAVVPQISSSFEQKEKKQYIESLTKEQKKVLSEFPGNENLNIEQIKKVISSSQLPDLGQGSDGKGKKVNSDNVDDYIDKIRGGK